VEAPRFHDNWHMKGYPPGNIPSTHFWCKANNLPPSCAVVTKSESLNFLESSGPVQACNGTAAAFSFMVQAESTPGPEVLCQRKVPVTQSGIETATLQLVAWCLDQLIHRVP